MTSDKLEADARALLHHLWGGLNPKPDELVAVIAFANHLCAEAWRDGEKAGIHNERLADDGIAPDMFNPFTPPKEAP